LEKDAGEGVFLNAGWMLFALALPAVYLESQPPVFRVAVEAVQVDVYVGRGGKAVTGLTKDDFELFDNGVRQTIELFDIETVPLNIALVLDTSQSVAGSKLMQLQSAAHSFLRGLEDKDRAGLITFSHRMQQVGDLTGELETLHHAIDQVEAYGNTIWRDALYAGLKSVEFAAHRPVVLLFTDGEDTYSWLREDQLMPLVKQSSAVVYVVYGSGERLSALAPDGPHSPRSDRAWKQALTRRAQSTELLRKLTEVSGGRFIETAPEAPLSDVFMRILAELKTRYLLTYPPSDVAQEGWHEIRIKLTKKKGEIRARRGYFCKPPQRHDSGSPF
jgi:Ca-activated chloride channel family protein